MKKLSESKCSILIIIIGMIIFGCQNNSGESSNPGKPIKSETEPQWLYLISDDASHWQGEQTDKFPEAGWEIKDNMLIVNRSFKEDSVRAGDLFTREKYGNFEFHFEWKMETVGGNSGIKYFVPGAGDSWDLYGPGPEYQILDDANHPWMLEGKMQPYDFYTMGSCYELYPADSVKAPAPLGEWNSSRIISDKGRVEHWLNGRKIVDYNRYSDDFAKRVSNSKFKDYAEYGRLEKGHIMLQDHGGEVYFKNMKIRTSDQ